VCICILFLTQENGVYPHCAGIPLTLGTTAGGKRTIPFKNIGLLSLHDILFAGRRFFGGGGGVPFVSNLKWNMCTALSTRNTTENNRIFSRALYTAAFQPDLFWNWMYKLLVTSKGRSALPNTDWQGQLRTSQSLTVYIHVCCTAEMEWNLSGALAVLPPSLLDCISSIISWLMPAVPCVSVR
jgi:hypothetical protein